METENPASPTSPTSLTKARKKKALKLRVEAGLAYMTDQSSPTLDQLSQDPRFDKVSRKTLERWSKEDRWVQKRAAFFENWSARARDRIGSQLCRLRQRDLNDLEELRNLAVDKLKDETVLPKSWEGVARVLLDATEHRDRIAGAIGQELMPQDDGQKKLTPADVGATSEEIQLVARELLKHRRDVHRAGSEIAPVSPPRPPPPPPIGAKVSYRESEPEPPTIDVSIGIGDEEEDE